MSSPRSRAEAKSRGELRYFTGKPCRNGHVCERLTSWATCLICHRHKEARRRENNVERLKRWRAESRDRLNRAEKNLAWRKTNAEVLDEKRKAYQRANRGKLNAATALYFCRKKRAAPKWIDRVKLREVYVNCPSGHHVDHIVPLKHDLVCGLHVPWNLQYLTPSENSRKKNLQTLEQLQPLAFTIRSVVQV